MRMHTNQIRAWHTPMFVHRHKHLRLKTKAGKPKVSTKKTYNLRAMFLLLHELKKSAGSHPLVVCLEQQQARPTDSKHVVAQVTASFTVWHVMVELLRLRCVVVTPSAWKPRYLPPEAPKKDSIAVCRQLYPRLVLPLAKDEAIAEAVLIADYVRRREQNLTYPRVRPVVPRKPKLGLGEVAPPPRSKRVHGERTSVLITTLTARRKLRRSP